MRVSASPFSGTTALRPALVFVVVWALLAAAGLLAVPPAAAETPAPPLGTTELFRADDWGNDQSITLLATVRWTGEHAVIYVQQGRPVPDGFLATLGESFDTRVYPSLTTVLGAEPNPGIDGQPRVVLLLYDFNDPSISGAFHPWDIDPHDGGGNAREMIYLNLESLVGDPDLAAAAAAHEFAHLIFYYRSYLLDPSPGKTYRGATTYRWIEEGVATYAELIAGYGTRAADALRSFALQPNKNLTRWEGGFLSDYGAGFGFMAYLAERAGQGVITDLVGRPLAGITGIDAVLGARGAFDTFASLFDDWVIANFLDGRPPAAPPYSLASVDVAAQPVTLEGAPPLVGDAQVKNYAATYLDLPPTPAGSPVQVVVDGDDGPYLHAALISWDASGQTAPSVTPLPLAPATGGGAALSPAGYERHTLAVWARGTESADTAYRFRYSAAADPAGDIQFLDVGSDHLYFPYIDTLLRRGIVSGKEVPPGSGLWYFRADDNVLRAQFAKMIVGAIGRHTEEIESPATPRFTDVGPTYDAQGRPLPYPYDYVEEAAAAGIVAGYTDGRFGPWEPITRVQLVRMILRAGDAVGHPFPAYRGSEAVFADVPPGSPLYAEVMTAYAGGIFSGSVDGGGRRLFSPWRPATRGHVAKMTANLLDRLETAG